MPFDFKNLKEMSKKIESVSAEELKNIEIGQIISRAQVRTKFENIDELAESIKAIGLQQPIVVTQPDANGKYTIIQGERRYLACKKAGLKRIAAIVRKAPETETQRILVQLTENIQRDDMDPFDVSEAMHQLVKSGVKAVKIAERLGKSKAYVSRIMSLQQLPQEIRKVAEDKEVHSPEVLMVMGEMSRKFGQAFFDKLCSLEEINRSNLRDLSKTLEAGAATSKKDSPKKNKVAKKAILPKGAKYVEKGEVVVEVSAVLGGAAPVPGYIHPHAISDDKNNVCVVIGKKTHVVPLEDVTMLGVKVL